MASLLWGVALLGLLRVSPLLGLTLLGVTLLGLASPGRLRAGLVHVGVGIVGHVQLLANHGRRTGGSDGRVGSINAGPTPLQPHAASPASVWVTETTSSLGAPDLAI